MRIFYASAAEIKPDFKSSTIMKYLGCDFSHVLHIIEQPGEEPYIWHSTGEGVNKKYLSDFLKDHVLKHKFEITDKLVVHPERFVGYLEGNEGKDYSETQYFGFISDIFGPVKRWLQKESDDNTRELICSEFTSRSANKYTSLRIKGDEDFQTPKSFIDQLINYGLKNLVK